MARSRASASATTAQEVERAAADARTGTEIVPAASLPPVPWTPPDPEIIGVTRRQFFNRTIVTLMSVSLGTFGLALIAFLYPRCRWWLRLEGQRRQAR